MKAYETPEIKITVLLSSDILNESGEPADYSLIGE